MTNKEAIEILENLIIQGKGFFSQRYALYLAINALNITEVIEEDFKRDSNLMMDYDDWKDIKAFVENEAHNEP